MPEPVRPDIARPDVDPSVPQTTNRHGTEGHYSGQEPGSFSHATSTHTAAGGVEGGTPADRHTGQGAGVATGNLPAEAGHRATVDQHTGAVHGSGVGVGGGAPGEDPDDDAGGSNTAAT